MVRLALEMLRRRPRASTNGPGGCKFAEAWREAILVFPLCAGQRGRNPSVTCGGISPSFR